MADSSSESSSSSSLSETESCDSMADSSSESSCDSMTDSSSDSEEELGEATGGEATGGEATGGEATAGKATGGEATGGTTTTARPFLLGLDLQYVVFPLTTIEQSSCVPHTFSVNPLHEDMISINYIHLIIYIYLKLIVFFLNCTV